ncbi:hypothetical protein [Pontibacter rugosus]|uniref:Uncharacterized protein n=1 Tax=Pontibacter rugosus TaxID=1745966 RepID=A0ABW3SNC9_9BACT
MSIKGFLQDLNEVFKENEEEKRKREEVVKQKEKEKKEFFELYSNIYNDGIVKKVKKIEKELKNDFKIRYKKGPEKPSFNTLEGSLTFQPKFVTDVYEIKIMVQGQFKDKTLVVLGNATYRLNAKHKGATEVFKDKIELFDPEQTEDFITKILRYFFIER